MHRHLTTLQILLFVFSALKGTKKKGKTEESLVDILDGEAFRPV